jgi:hypothetical protein
LADHLRWLLDHVETKADVFRDLSENCKLIFFCAFASENGQGGFTLDPATLARLAALKIPFSLDLYPPERVWDNDEGQSDSLSATKDPA